MLAITVPSRSREGVTYSLQVQTDGASCQCPGFFFHKHCYHSDAFLRFTEALAAGPPKKRKKAA
jgi:hypothetical protein